MTMRPTSAFMAALLAGGALAGCGLKGDLETPAPLFGARDREPLQPEAAPEDDTPREPQLVFPRDETDSPGVAVGVFPEEPGEDEEPSEGEDASDDDGAATDDPG